MPMHQENIDRTHKDDDIRNFYWVYKIKLFHIGANIDFVEDQINELGSDGWECFNITELHKNMNEETGYVRYYFKKRMDKRYLDPNVEY